MYFFIWLMNKYPFVGECSDFSTSFGFFANRLLGKLMMGDVNKELNSWSAEDEVRKALEKLSGAEN